MTFAPASTAVAVIDFGAPLYAVGYACVHVSTEHNGSSIRTKAEAHTVSLKHSRN